MAGPVEVGGFFDARVPALAEEMTREAAVRGLDVEMAEDVADLARVRLGLAALAANFA